MKLSEYLAMCSSIPPAVVKEAERLEASHDELLAACKASVAEITGGSMFPTSLVPGNERPLKLMLAAISQGQRRGGATMSDDYAAERTRIGDTPDDKDFQFDLGEFMTSLGLTGDPVDAVSQLAWSQVLKDIKAGFIPKTVSTFSELHDYVDANCYGDSCAFQTLIGDVDDEDYVQAHCDFWNAVQNRVHERLARGEHRESVSRV